VEKEDNLKLPTVRFWAANRFWVGQQGEDVSELDGCHVDQEGVWIREAIVYEGLVVVIRSIVYEVEEAWRD